MKILKFETEADWLKAREGKITGSNLKKIIKVRGAIKVGSWEWVAGNVCTTPEVEETDVERGNRLEETAIAKAAEKTGVVFKSGTEDRVIWQSDEYPQLTVSPDGFTEDNKIAIETKCPGVVNHIKYLETIKDLSSIDDYKLQILQYFVVNPNLEALYFVSYNEQMPKEEDQTFVLKIERSEIIEAIEKLRADLQAEITWGEEIIKKYGLTL